MKLNLALKIDHSGYGDGELHDVVAGILREAADKIERGAWTHTLQDIQGKKLGDVRVAFETNTKHLTNLHNPEPEAFVSPAYLIERTNETIHPP